MIASRALFPKGDARLRFLGAANRCCALPVSTIRPASITAIRCAICRASIMSCVIMSMARPRDCCNRTRSAAICAATNGSSALVASSSKSISGSTDNARANATRCACPPLIARGRRSAMLAVRPTSSSSAATFASRSARVHSGRRWTMGSATDCATVHLGLRLANGSWNTGWMSAR